MTNFETFTGIAITYFFVISGAFIMWKGTIDDRPALTVLYGTGLIYTVIHGQYLYGWWV